MTIRSFPLALLLLGACLLQGFLLTPPAEARVYLDITAAELRKLPMAVPYFSDQKQAGVTTDKGKELAALFSKAIAVHGFIAIVPPDSYGGSPSADLQKTGADFAVLNNYDSTAAGMVMEFRLMDLHENKMILGKRYQAPWAKSSKILRQFADEVVKQLSGEQGISNTMITYISDEPGVQEVYVADILGEQIRRVTKHNHLTASPRFSPDGSKLLYSSWHSGNPNLYITDLSQSVSTKAISKRPGLNYAASFRPNGKEIALSLRSEDGNTDIYLMDPGGKINRRLTQNAGINTSVSWSPDGENFAFVSDRSGSPQVYIMNVDSGKVDRVTFTGTENSTPSWSPKGDQLAYTGLSEGTRHIFTIPTKGGQATRITNEGGEYEAPSWSPDGRQMVMVRARAHKKEICSIFANGQGITPLFKQPGNQTTPQWSPRLPY